MPAQIFARLGLWQNDIDSNLASKAAAEATGLHHEAEHRLHAMEFLEYAYLQTGRFDEANAIVTEAGTVLPTDVHSRYRGMWAAVESRLPALLTVETKNWTMATHLKVLIEGSPSSQLATLLAHAEAAAYLRDAASEALQQLELLASADSRVSNSVAAETRAWAHCALGKLNDAVAALQPLAER